MLGQIAKVEKIFVYPVKSMAGIELTDSNIAWHGLDGDRRFAFKIKDSIKDFPWLTASKFPKLILYHVKLSANKEIATIINPNGKEFKLRSRELIDDISNAYGAEVELINLKNGIFDDEAISLISTESLQFLSEEVQSDLDVKRFRPNILINLINGKPFGEDELINRTIKFGKTGDGLQVRILKKDIRCVMINLDPNSALQNPKILKSVVKLNSNCSGVYGKVIQMGEIRLNDPIFLL